MFEFTEYADKLHIYEAAFAGRVMQVNTNTGRNASWMLIWDGKFYD